LVPRREEERALLVCGWAALLGRVSEENLAAVADFANVNFTKGTPLNIVRYYLGTGFLTIYGNGALATLIHAGRAMDINDEDLELAKQEIKLIRKRLFDG
jgi:hypothetical protein